MMFEKMKLVFLLLDHLVDKISSRIGRAWRRCQCCSWGDRDGNYCSKLLHGRNRNHTKVWAEHAD